ncbi:MAG: plasmid mobilization relaxosome protein MobC [Cyclobacteriaceae bacterium]
MRGPMIDLVGIREELKRIGTNINQITHAFHVAETDSQKVFHALRVAEQYKMVDERVERLLGVVSELAKKWLSGDYEKKVKIEIRLPDSDEEHP